MTAREANFDGLVGPTHNYAGLSRGNIASLASRASTSSPRRAALQGLAKMRALHDLGIPQAVLPPQERPDVTTLRRLGFAGDDARVIERAAREAPALLHACCSASAMWTANAATVSPGADTADGRVHFTPANLSSKFHRSLESPATARALRAIFADPAHFAHHPPLPPGEHFADEGAANHTRLCTQHDAAGLELFVYGRQAFDDDAAAPRRFPARQTREASRSVARLHGLDASRSVFARQHPDAIDAGVFHNDVIAVGHRDLLFCHTRAFADQRRLLAELRARFPGELRIVEVADAQVMLAEAVETYLFNSQIVSPPDGGLALIAPVECRTQPRVRTCLDALATGTPFRAVHYLDVRESMRNGGGPACLRLRVVLNDDQRAAVNPAVWFDAALHRRLGDWVERHYRDRLTPADLADPQLLDEGRAALDELTRILDLGALYPFQRAGG